MSKKSNKIGIVQDRSYFLHDTGPGHPESSVRLEELKEVFDKLSDISVDIAPRTATRDELLLVHTPLYVDKILSREVTEREMLDPDTVFSPGTKEAARKAVGGVLEAVDRVTAGSFDRIFCAVRPPGHHAEADRAMGFCIFNNVAVGAAYALQEKRVGRVAVIDWDLHHGNGTQNTFYDSREVLYISLHQFPFYPGTGSSMENGSGEGKGFTVNIPMPFGSGVDDYRDAFNMTVIPSLERFEPGLIFISAGFDAHRYDPLSGILLDSAYYGEMTSAIREIAEKYCGGRIVSVLEGGYNPKALQESVEIHLKELAG